MVWTIREMLCFKTKPAALGVCEVIFPIFRSFIAKENVSKKRLSDRSVANIIKRRIEMIGLDPGNYSGHSLRAGFATSASIAGFPMFKKNVTDKYFKD